MYRDIPILRPKKLCQLDYNCSYCKHDPYASIRMRMHISCTNMCPYGNIGHMCWTNTDEILTIVHTPSCRGNVTIPIRCPTLLTHKKLIANLAIAIGP